jgi:hypothetical protein
MRFLGLLLIASALGSCTAAPPADTSEMMARQQAKLAELTAGKVAGPTLSCIPQYSSNDMRVIDDNTIAFRDGPSRLYVTHMNGGCTNLENGHNALVTRTTVSQLCRGDIAQVIDTSTRMFVGACTFGDFVPYTRAGARY